MRMRFKSFSIFERAAAAAKGTFPLRVGGGHVARTSGWIREQNRI